MTMKDELLNVSCAVFLGILLALSGLGMWFR